MKIVIAPKRSSRDSAPENWIEAVRDTPGVSELVQSSFGRVTVEATRDALELLRSRLGETFHVEEVVKYGKQD